jgi:hypothetical protein
MTLTGKKIYEYYIILYCIVMNESFYRRIVSMYVFFIVIIKLLFSLFFSFDYLLKLYNIKNYVNPAIYQFLEHWYKIMEHVFLLSVAFLLILVFWPFRKVPIVPSLTERFIFFVFGFLTFVSFLVIF